MNPIYNLRHKIQMLKDFLQLLSTGPVTISPSLYKKNITYFFCEIRTRTRGQHKTIQYKDNAHYKTLERSE